MNSNPIPAVGWVLTSAVDAGVRHPVVAWLPVDMTDAGRTSHQLWPMAAVDTRVPVVISPQEMVQQRLILIPETKR